MKRVLSFVSVCLSLASLLNLTPNLSLSLGCLTFSASLFYPLSPFLFLHLSLFRLSLPISPSLLFSLCLPSLSLSFSPFLFLSIAPSLSLSPLALHLSFCLCSFSLSLLPLYLSLSPFLFLSLPPPLHSSLPIPHCLQFPFSSLFPPL